MEDQSTPGFWLSPQQQHLWLTQSGERPCNAAIMVRIDGVPDKKRLRDALQQIVSRYEVLRTAFRRHPGMKIPFQSPLETGSVLWSETNLTESSQEEQLHQLQEFFQAELAREFDLFGEPCLRARMVGLSPEQEVLILSLPTLLSDTPSLTIILREAASIYADSRSQLEEDPIRYVQIAQWQAELLDSDDETSREGKTFWNQPATTLSGPESLPLSSDASQPFVSDSVPFSLPDALFQFNYPSHVVLLAAWQTLIWRLSGQALFSTRVFFQGREHDELRNAPGIVGRFVPVPARFDGEFSFADVMAHVQTAMTAAAEWQEYYRPSTEKAGGVPVSFEYFDGPSSWTGDSLRFSIVRQQAHIEPFGIQLSVMRTRDAFSARLFYDCSRFGKDTVEGWVGNFVSILSAAGKSPNEPVSSLQILPEAERNRILIDWNRTAAPVPGDRCIHQLFESQVERTPDRPAVRSQGRELSFSQLNQGANRLARHLQQLGVRRGDKVGLCLEPSVDLITGLLAILKAGAAYVPLNPDNPKQRLDRQLKICAALLTDAGFSTRIPEFESPVVCLDADSRPWDVLESTNPDAGAGPEDFVYVIHTSGSTGVPKGVAVRHRNLVNYTSYIAHWLQLEQFESGLNFATVTTISADLGNTCVFPSLTSGGCLHLLGHDIATDVALLEDVNTRYAIDVLKIVPSHLDALLANSGSSALFPAKYLIMGGESLQRPLLRKIELSGAKCRVMNHYGPTETTVGSLTLDLPHQIPAGWPARNVPIGKPIWNTHAYILDSRLQPVPPGVTGELYIGGEGVAAGYLDSLELTSERFLANPFVSGTRMYRTGDRARFLADGNVEYLGRSDDQVKIRGFRIELGEIEMALCGFDEVKQAAVAARTATKDELQLVAYLVPFRDREINITRLREYLKTRIPGYMIPAAMIVLPKLPLTVNGKLDRASLPDPDTIQNEARQYVAPQTLTEGIVTGIWTEVFRRERIGATDDFFEIGGHSLLATQVISRVREQFRIEISMRTMFEGPTIQALSRAVDAASASEVMSEEAEIVPVARDTYRRK